MAAVSTITTKGQLTIPKEIRDLLGLHQGDMVLFDLNEKGLLHIIPAGSKKSKLEGLIAPWIKHGKKAPTLKEMDKAIARGSGRFR